MDAKWESELINHRDDAFKVAVITIEHVIDQFSQNSHQEFLWFSRLHFQLDVFVYFIGELCSRTSGAMVEKAWEVVEKTYIWNRELLDTTQRAHKRLAAFVFKAWEVRERMLRERFGLAPEPPEYILNLRATMPWQDNSNNVLAPTMNRLEARDNPFNHLIDDCLYFNIFEPDVRHYDTFRY